VRVGGYGPVAGYQASPLLGSTPLADTLVWRSRGIDPSGFYNLGARYYDPVAGHFLSPDPLGHAASLDLYSFCGGDPLNRFDPTGRFAKGNFEQGYQTLQSAGRAFGEGARQFDMAHEDEIQQTLMEVDGAAVCFALPVLAEGLLGEGMGAGAGMALEEGEIGGVEGFNLRSASWAARLEGSEGVGLAEVGTSESKIAGSAASTIVENTGAVEAEAASMAETGAAKESGALANGGRASRSLDLEDSSAVDHEARNAAADAEWETQNPASTPLLLKAPNRTRFSRDVAVNPTAPAPLPLNRAIGGTPAQQQALTTDIQYARSLKATDIRVNQQQVNATGQRVGVNRPDLQYSLPNGTRVYIEYDNTTPATWPNTPRGPGHGIRILSNDPNGVYIQRSF